jgi:hypothetical protein
MPTELAAWLAQPFSTNMSAARWFLFIGLIVVALWGWHQIARDFSAVEGDL